jgi:dihydrofolate synthase/folylpolyglutamate synthase
MKTFRHIDEVWTFLEGIPKFQNSGASAANFSFENVLHFLDEIGNPHQDLPAIHIAGTNGKGTTGYLLEKVYHEAGFTTGLFTSPHLLRYNERIRLNMVEIPDQELMEFFNRFGRLLQDITLSYFEISTVLAFWYFKKQEVDVALIETGLGGRLDTTNVIQPIVSIITSVGLDHQDILGDTIEEIAAEKAGIIKKKTPVIVGDLPEPALRVCRKFAKEMEAPVTHANSTHPEWNKGVITLNKPGTTIKTSFRESVNKWNVAMVWQAIDLLKDRFSVEEKTLIMAIEKFQGAPGRFEKIHPDFEWYFSGSHNQDALLSSLKAINELKSPEKAVVVFSAMKDKVRPEFLEHFRDFGRRYFVEQTGERAAKFTEIRKQIPVQLMDETNAGIILNELKTELVIFMGSFYFYPIVKRWTTNVS